MKAFFNKYFNIRYIMEKKKEYRQQTARIAALPEEYRYTLKKIQSYMWNFVSVDGYDFFDAQAGIIELFEEGAANKKSVLDITGPDVAGFVDELLKNSNIDKKRKKLNKDIAQKVGKSPHSMI